MTDPGSESAANGCGCGFWAEARTGSRIAASAMRAINGADAVQFLMNNGLVFRAGENPVVAGTEKVYTSVRLEM